jgi:putative inorganic carbon (HCO3(-)) transporter
MASGPGRAKAPVRRARPVARKRTVGTAQGDDERTLQRIVVLVLAASTAVLVWPPAYESFNLPRVTFVFLGAIALLALWGLQAAGTGRLVVPKGPLLPILGAFVAFLFVSGFVADYRMVALLGTYGRYAGLAAYLCYALVCLTVVHAFDANAVRTLALVLVGSLAVVVVYGLLQVLGADPFDWGADPVRYSTLGQTNFAAGYVAIATPVALWVVADRTMDQRLRLGALATAVLSLVYLWSVDAFQGPMALAPAMVLVAGVVIVEHRQPAPVQRHPRVAAAGALAVVAVLGAVALAGPFRDQLDTGLDERRLMWSAGASMVADRPVWGHGLGSYRTLFTEHRPEEHGTRFGTAIADAPHDVPLDLAVSGGALLLGAYLAFVAYTGWGLVRGLRSLRGPDRLLLAGVGGGWLAYQVQSLVSIDVPSLALLHWILAGAVIVLGHRPAVATWGLPGVAGRSSHRRHGAPVPLGTRALQLGAVALVLVAAWTATRPLRADMAAGSAADLLEADDPVASEERLERAVDLAPWEATYYAFQATLYRGTGREELALAAALRASDASPGSIRFVLSTANLARALGRDELAQQLYLDVLRRDPNDVEVDVEVGEYLAATGDAAGAVERFERAVRARPDSATFWRSLATANVALGDEEAAEAAFRRVLELEPGAADASSFLRDRPPGD